MLLKALLLVLAASAVLGHEAWIKTPPKNVRLENGTPIAKTGEFLQLIEAMLGLSTEKCTFSGAHVASPFGAAKSLVLLSVETDSEDLFKAAPGVHFPIKQELPLVHVAESLDATLAAKFGDEAQVKRQEEVDYDAKEKPYQLKALNETAFPDSYFLAELQRLIRLPEEMESASRVLAGPQVLWAAVHTLPVVEATHGKQGAAAKEAKALLADAVATLDRELSSAGHVLVTVSGDEKAVRHKREAPAPSQEADPSFGPIFQIMLWFSIFFALALLYIAVGIGNMDPGRDSIIYRMTSTRMKKDN